MHTEICRGCLNENLDEILDLGFAPPSNSLLTKDDFSRGEIHYPLVLLFCNECKLVQTRDFLSGEALFTPNYPYLSSTSSTWITHTRNLVEKLITDFDLSANSLVVEIASNDGYLLEHLVMRGIPNYGVEPTKLAADISVNKGHVVYNQFLTSESALGILDKQRPADLLIANNVFAHVDDLTDFTKAVRALLSHDGVVVIEVQYFAELFARTLFDTIYHEHFSYFTITSLYNLLQKHGIGVFKVEFLSTHGGSIRIFARNNDKGEVLDRLIEPFAEYESKATSLSDLLEFQESVDRVRRRIKGFFLEQQRNNRQIAGLGAAAKGNTLINFLGFGTDEIKCIFDSAVTKHGKYMPGSHIPVYSMESISHFPEIQTFITLPWNIARELANETMPRASTQSKIYKLMPNFELLN